MLKKVLIYSSLLAIIVAGRGLLLAWIMEGGYAFNSFIHDWLGLLLVMAICRFIYFVFNWLIDKALQGSSFLNRAGKTLSQLTFVLIVIFPVLLVAVQMHPQKIAIRQTPGELGLVFENVIINSENLKLKGWYLPSSDSSKPALVVAHGLNANKQNFLPIAENLSKLGFPVLIFDFRAHGDSDGHLFTFGIKESKDVKSAHDFLKDKLPGRSIYAIGYSAGAASVLRAMSEYDIFERAILDAGLYDIEQAAKDNLLYYTGPLQRPLWVIGNFYAKILSGKDLRSSNLMQVASKIQNRKFLLIHGNGDLIIPTSQTLALAKVLPGAKEPWIINGAGHLETFWTEGYWERVNKFFLD